MSARSMSSESTMSGAQVSVEAGLVDPRVWLREAYSYYYYFSFSGRLLHATRRRA
jgi:hypothetical protein